MGGLTLFENKFDEAMEGHHGRTAARPRRAGLVRSQEGQMMMVAPKFPLGRVVATLGALEAMQASGQTPDFFMDQHASCNWGEVDEGDWALNDQALKDGSRLLSA
jgi:hypothetical protein